MNEIIFENNEQKIIIENDESIIVNEITDEKITETSPVIVTVNVNNIQKDFIAGESIISFHAVVLLNDKLYLANKDDATHVNKVIGLSLQSGNANDTITVLIYGVAYLQYWNLVLNSNYFVGNNGDLLGSKPTTGFLQCIGFADTTDKLFVKLSEPINLISDIIAP